MMHASDYRAAAWKKMNGNWGIMALSTILFGLISNVPLLAGVMQYGYSSMALDVSRGKSARFETLFKGFDNFVNVFLLSLLLAVFTFLWTLLLIIPGIIMSYAYSMSYYIMIDDPSLSPSQARARSIELMRGNKWRLFCLQFSFIGWTLLSVLTFGILAFFIQPYMETATAEFYRSLIEEKSAEKSAPVSGGANAPVQPTASIKNDIFCSECGAANSSDYIFCVECGTRLKKRKPNTVTCAACGAETSSDAEYCSNCGYKLSKQTSSSSVSKHKFCTNCGKEVSNGDTFCSNCGNRINRE